MRGGVTKWPGKTVDITAVRERSARTHLPLPHSCLSSFWACLSAREEEEEGVSLQLGWTSPLLLLSHCFCVRLFFL